MKMISVVPSRICQWLLALFGTASLSIVLLPGAARAAPLPRADGGYVYYAENTPVSKVLADFCTTFGIRLRLTQNIDGKVLGKLSSTSATEYLNRITSTLGLTWFYHAGTLYVAPVADWETRTLVVSREALPGLKEALADIGILETRFGWATLPDQGMVLVSGPQEYVNLVATTVQSLHSAPRGQQIAVFRLQHANVDDRTIISRDKPTVIPGVATILRALVSNRRTNPASIVRAGADIARPNPDMLAEAAAQAPARPNLLSEDARASTTTASVAPRPSDTSIEADIRLNAVIIKDTPEAIAMYQKLIAALDIPTGLIEIEAVTIDINNTRLDELGIDWSAGVGGVRLGFGDSSKAIGTGDLSLGYRPDAMTILGNQAASLIAKIRALESTGDARVVGKPSILTTNNLVALIDLSQTLYVRVLGERVANLVPVTTGVMLKVTPRLIENSEGPAEIQLVIDIEDGTLVDQKNFELPIVQRSVISTQATIKENQSLLIGGYDTESDQQHTSGVPGLSRIPVLGGLFRNTQMEKQRRKRLFLITPRVVSSNPADALRRKPATSSGVTDPHEEPILQGGE
jgi:type III secretion protein C